MFVIGQFAQVAKVSVRALRHYDEVGLLKPAAVDASTGYRSYSAAQLPLLNRILVLKDLGFTLAEITRTIEAGVSTDELIGMLRLRQAEAEQSAEAERKRLARVAARIDILTGVLTMTEVSTDVVVKPLDEVRVAVVGEPADGFDVEFAPLFARLYPALFSELGQAGVAPCGPTYGLYDQRADGRIDVMAGVVISSDAELDSDAAQVRTLPAAERAATLVHLGSMETIAQSFSILDRWIEAAGETAQGYAREVYLDCPEDQADWVTELQFVLA
jgi:DNA-binding transcriptional MerR regulator